MDPLMFMLAFHYIKTAEYDLWLGIPFTERVTDELNFDEFSGTRLMPSIIVSVCVFAPFISFNQSLSVFLYFSNT